MPTRSTVLPLVLAALMVSLLAGVLAPSRSVPAAAVRAAAVRAPAARPDEIPFEFVLFGDSLDAVRLEAGAAPHLVHRVEAGEQLSLTDVDATAGGLVIWRRSERHLEQVGFVVERPAVGLGQCSRSYATGIPFGPGDELLVQAAGGAVEWAVLRGIARFTDADLPPAGP